MDIRYSLIIRAQTSAPHFHLYKMAALRVMRCRVVQGKRELFCGESARRPAEMATADLPKDSKPPLTLRPNFKSEKGSVTAAAAAYTPRRGIFVGENKASPFRGGFFIQALLKSEAILPHTPTKTAHFRQTHRKRAVSYLSDERMIQSNASISMQRPATS